MYHGDSHIYYYIYKFRRVIKIFPNDNINDHRFNFHILIKLLFLNIYLNSLLFDINESKTKLYNTITFSLTTTVNVKKK